MGRNCFATAACSERNSKQGWKFCVAAVEMAGLSLSDTTKALPAVRWGIEVRERRAGGGVKRREVRNGGIGIV